MSTFKPKTIVIFTRTWDEKLSGGDFLTMGNPLIPYRFGGYMEHKLTLNSILL